MNLTQPNLAPPSPEKGCPTTPIIPAITFLLGIVAAYLVFRQQISAIEGWARNDLERWKLECTSDIRKDSVNRSRSTLKGRISGQMAPLLPEFPFSSADARFIGNPIDFVVFDGYTLVKDEKGDTISVVLVEVKKGKGRLTREEGLIKKAVCAEREGTKADGDRNERVKIF
ncbi:MAG TPA: Holliday junction resolvase-like protein [Methanoregula sp.]|nr:Holliday junction resolvase-like protein [Methanoregula sp.]